MNNRQAGRRRGRGGQRPQGGNPSQGNGNRIDNRARGNAAQLLEKYRNLARDAQMQGDRVNSEYYFQFADHYFRVLSETRSRFEENNPQQQRQRPSDDEDDFDYENEGNRADEPRGNEARDSRGEREPRANGHVNGNGVFHPNEDDQPAPRETQRRETQPRDRDGEDDGQRRRARGRRDAAPREEAEVAPGIDAAVLPPAFGIETAASEESEEKPRRRGRRPRGEDVPVA